jgi:hypothetical protein
MALLVVGGGIAGRCVENESLRERFDRPAPSRCPSLGAWRVNF